jgi:hypothetical protein
MHLEIHPRLKLYLQKVEPVKKLLRAKLKVLRMKCRFKLLLLRLKLLLPHNLKIKRWNLRPR